MAARGGLLGVDRGTVQLLLRRNIGLAGRYHSRKRRGCTVIDWRSHDRGLAIGLGTALVLAALVGVACENVPSVPTAPSVAPGSQATPLHSASGSLAAATNATV